MAAANIGIRWGRGLRRFYPLSFFGTLIIVSGLLLLGNGLLFSDGFAVVIGALAFLLCLCLSGAVLFQTAGRLRDAIHWNSGGNLIAFLRNENHSAFLSSWDLPPFLRFHISLRARLLVGNLLLYHFHRDYCFHGTERLPLEIVPPVPGRMQMKGEFYLSDIFGITRRSILFLDKRSAHVLPPGEGMSEVDLIRTSQSEDDKQMTKKSETEKIFIRDYQPGDLARDINWKASGRIHKLLTRIPPESESLSRLIQILLLADSRILELAYLKSLVRGFIDRMLSNDANAIFRIWLHNNQYEVNNDDSMELFLKALAEWRPAPYFQADDLPSTDRNMTIFSHERCVPLKKLLHRYEDCRLFLVRGWRGGRYDRSMAQFPGEGFIPLSLPEMRGGAPAMDSLLPGNGVELREYILKKVL